MKHLNAFHATKVFSHLDMNIEFFPQLTFLYGLNGSGKTTALRLIMGLLQPSLRTLYSIGFESAIVTGVSREHEEIRIRATRSEERVTLECSAVDGILDVAIEELESDQEPEAIGREEARSEVVQTIRDISSPMFLGIERRFITPERRRPRVTRHSSRELASRFRRERMDIEGETYDPGLAEVAEIIQTYVSRLHGAQERVNDKYRKELLLESFPYVEQSTREFSFDPPSEAEFADFRKKRDAISAALLGLNVASEEFEQRSIGFFNAIEGIINKIRDVSGRARKGEELDKEASEALTAWFVNQSQMERINRLFDITTKYQEQTETTYRPLTDFVKLVNEFFAQTGKDVTVGREGDVSIRMPNGEKASLLALSSGERQIFIMLAHLSLDRRLPGDGVFIVDEPELSLHLDWQDMFVGAIEKANPRLQLILATHAPAIIGGRDEFCVPVISVETKQE